MKSHIRRVEKFIPPVESVEIQEIDLYRMQQSEQLRKLQQQTDDMPVDFCNHFKVVNDDGTTIDLIGVGEAGGTEMIKIEHTQNLSQDSLSSMSVCQ